MEHLVGSVWCRALVDFGKQNIQTNKLQRALSARHTHTGLLFRLMNKPISEPLFILRGNKVRNLTRRAGVHRLLFSPHNLFTVIWLRQIKREAKL